MGTIFVTSGSWTGNLGGMAGADSKCDAAVANAGFEGAWVALISTSSTDAIGRLPTGISFVRMDNAVIANNRADLFDGTIQNPINLNENNGIETGHVFTGSESDGTVSDNCGGMDTCGDWTAGAVNGEIGMVSQTDSNWIQSGCFSTCDSELKGIYCVRTA